MRTTLRGPKDTKLFAVHLPAALIHRIKIDAARRNKVMRVVVTQALEAAFPELKITGFKRSA